MIGSIVMELTPAVMVPALFTPVTPVLHYSVMKAWIYVIILTAIQCARVILILTVMLMEGMHLCSRHILAEVHLKILVPQMDLLQ